LGRTACGSRDARGKASLVRGRSFDPDDPPAVRRYALYPLSDDEIVTEEGLHDLFRKHVGTHIDWEVRGTADAAVQPRSEWARFYESAEAKRDREYTKRSPIGWFTL
jgi:hypothetical protein